MFVIADSVALFPYVYAPEIHKFLYFLVFYVVLFHYRTPFSLSKSSSTGFSFSLFSLLSPHSSSFLFHQNVPLLFV